MNLSRRAPLQHPFAALFHRAIDAISAALTPQTERQYRGAARNFLIFLAESYPELNALDQLRREFTYPRLADSLALPHPTVRTDHLYHPDPVSA